MTEKRKNEKKLLFFFTVRGCCDRNDIQATIFQTLNLVGSYLKFTTKFSMRSFSFSSGAPIWNH